MIVHCEECGRQNSVSAKDMAASKGFVQCKFCKDYFQVPKEKLGQALHSVAGVNTASQLLLSIQGKIVHVNERHPMARIGRNEDCHIRIADRRVSRLHATIEYIKGKYVLVDSSLNGTYVLIEGREMVSLKKEKLVLVNKGIIGVGRKADEKQKNTIHFTIAVDVNKTLQRLKDAHAHLT